MDHSIALNALLVKFLRNSTGVKQIMLSDATGLVISKVSKEKETFLTTDFEGIASLSSALYLGVSMLNLGKLGFSFTEFSNAKLCILGVTKDYVLIAIIDRNTSTKKLRSSMRKLSKEVSNQLDFVRESEKIEVKQQEIYKKSQEVSKDDFEKMLEEFSF
ncbi:MAG: roadblock/LC7 domain-containing protein [Candidatus Hodarchaeales archaeon]|jgi:predicted regulator of Ras-like GTPase activity (Roadblock/LC7/MglB family)